MLCHDDSELDYEEDNFDLLESHSSQKEKKSENFEDDSLNEGNSRNVGGNTQIEKKSENVKDNLTKWYDDHFLEIDLNEDEDLIPSEAISETVCAEPKPTKAKHVITDRKNEMGMKRTNFSEKKILSHENVRSEVKVRRKKSWPYRRPRSYKKTRAIPALMSNFQQKKQWIDSSYFNTGANISQFPSLFPYQRFNSQRAKFSSNLEIPFLNYQYPLSSSATSLQQKKVTFPWNNQYFTPLPKSQNNSFLKKFIPHPRFHTNQALNLAGNWMNLTPGNSLKSNFEPSNGNVDFYKNTFNQGVAQHSSKITKSLGNSASSFACQLNVNPSNNLESYGYSPGGRLKKREKEMVELKKEARLQRFKSEEVIGEESKPASRILKDSDFFFGEEYFRKMEEQKRQREKILSLKEKQMEIRSLANCGDLRSEIPTMNKYSLLKKKNPFDTDPGLVEPFLATKVKTEVGCKDSKEEGLKNLMLDALYQGEGTVRASVLKANPRDSPGLRLVKNGTINVAFVRTVSKTCDELGLSKLEFLNPKVKSPRTPAPLNRAHFAAEEMKEPEQPQAVVPQLTGCVVKVLNIPQSTTNEDIHELCRPVGRALEVKLNVPKENSALIRFGNPSFADNFYTLYHGQKMQNYFLNVIVI